MAPKLVYFYSELFFVATSSRTDHVDDFSLYSEASNVLIDQVKDKIFEFELGNS